MISLSILSTLSFNYIKFKSLPFVYRSFKKRVVIRNDIKQCSTYESATKHTPYSSIYLSGRYATSMSAVLQPLFNLNYMQNLVQDRDNIKNNMRQRSMDIPNNIDEIFEEINNLIQLQTQLSPLKKLQEKMHKQRDKWKKKNEGVNHDFNEKMKENNAKIKEIKGRIWDLEETVMPFILSLPNHVRNDVPLHPDNHNILYEHRPKKNTNFKQLDFTKLSYINKCYYKSLIGPNAHYLLSIGTQLEQSLIQYFTNSFDSLGFIHFSGLDFVKSAIVEAVNTDIKFESLKSDASRVNMTQGITDMEEGSQLTHLVGHSSLEAMIAFFLKSKRIMRDQVNNENTQVRLISIGNEFEELLAQQNTVHAICLCKPDDSSREMKLMVDKLWETFKQIDVPCRVLNCSVQEMSASEHARYEIQVWLQSQSEWLRVAHVSHTSDHVATRIGLNHLHIIDTLIVDTFPLIKSIIENNQTQVGNFSIPDCLK